MCRDRVIARAHNLTETLTDVTAHAEMQAITMAANELGGKYLTDCTLYVTVEPCVMCAGALGWSQLPSIVFGCRDEKRGYQQFAPHALHPRTTITGGILEDECRSLMQDFFRESGSQSLFLCFSSPTINRLFRKKTYHLTISQCPPLSGPIRFMIPDDCNCRICLAMPLFAILRVSATAVIDICGFCFMSIMICFCVVFSPLFIPLSTSCSLFSPLSSIAMEDSSLAPCK